MAFSPEFEADISSDKDSPLVRCIHNDSMCVGFGGIRNTKTWGKPNLR